MPGEGAAINDVPRERAELYLLHQLKLMPSWPSHYSQRPPDELGRRGFERDERAHVLRQFRGSVEVLAAIGILDQGEAAAWLSRFRSAPEAEMPSVPEPDRDLAMEERARRLLEERLAQAAVAPSGEGERAAMARFDEALRAVRVTGALSREEIQRFPRRLGEAASVEGQEWFRARPESPLPRWQGTELERVVIGPPERHAGLAITHAELHADALVIHWHRVAPIELPQGREPSRAERARAVHAAYRSSDWPELEVGDDLGTVYRLVPPGGPFHEYAESDDVVVAWVAQRFRPAVPEEASELRVGFEEAQFTLSLAP